MADERARIEIGFEGGQGMSVMVEQLQAEELERLLTEGADGAYALEAEDGRYVVSLRRVLYVKRFTRESRVGFSG